jgi:malate synthase
LDQGLLLAFLSDSAYIRAADWKVASTPPDLEKRWVEITGPVDRKMMINALNSGADVFMADFEDSLSPTREDGTWTGRVCSSRGSPSLPACSILV